MRDLYSNSLGQQYKTSLTHISGHTLTVHCNGRTLTRGHCGQYKLTCTFYKTLFVVSRINVIFYIYKLVILVTLKKNIYLDIDVIIQIYVICTWNKTFYVVFQFVLNILFTDHGMQQKQKCLLLTHTCMSNGLHRHSSLFICAKLEQWKFRQTVQSMTSYT